jgi:hypothetical protein
MVDWDRVKELRSKGWDWARIASDPDVAFHPDASAGTPGLALRALYHRTGRAGRRAEVTSPRLPRKGTAGAWSLLRVGYLLTAAVGVWALLAYAAPSPVGLLLPAIPYLLLLLGVSAFPLVFSLWRATGRARWSALYRNAAVGGVVVGLVVAGTISLVGVLLFGCPYLPPASSEAPVPGSPGWEKVPAAAWTEGGVPVVYFYGAVWCPFCSASSWAVWKALNEFGTTFGNHTSYSYGPPEPYAYTPEMVLAHTQMGPLGGRAPAIDLQVSEYDGPQDGVFPSASSCYQAAYASAYSGGSIPFVVIGGQYLHAMTTLVDPTTVAAWEDGANGGASAVLASVAHEQGSPWTDVGASTIQNQCCWIMALVVRAVGSSVPSLSTDYHWSPAVTSEVWADLNASLS